MTDAQIPLAGVIGCPISHSKSPLLHGYWLQKYNIRGHYLPLHVSHENFAKVLKLMPDMGFVGANITLPHKQAALAISDTQTEIAQKIGAANTLTFSPNSKIHADNTDAAGFINNLYQNAPHWVPGNGPAIVLGAGGASRAVLVALINAGVPQIFLANRTEVKAKDLADEFGPIIKPVHWEQAESYMLLSQLIVNTTSLGMVGQPEMPFLNKGLSRNSIVTDIVYNPLETAFLREARKLGCHCVDGLGMLLHQAAPGFARWFGLMPMVDDATRQAVLQ
jgi:shikimate dehydrogenase